MNCDAAEKKLKLLFEAVVRMDAFNIWKTGPLALYKNGCNKLGLLTGNKGKR